MAAQPLSARAPGALVDGMHILVLANQTCPCPELHDYVHSALPGDAPSEVTVVAPALNNSRLAHFVSDSDEAIQDAELRLAQAIEGLKAENVSVQGQVGDARPITALEDALAVLEVDAVVLSTFPAGESHWLEDGLVEEAQARLSVPVHHFVTEYGLKGTGKDPVAS